MTHAVADQNFSRALAQATEIVAQRRSAAPAGFDPQNVVAEPVAETALGGSELLKGVLSRMGAEGRLLKVVEEPRVEVAPVIEEEVSGGAPETAPEAGALPEVTETPEEMAARETADAEATAGAVTFTAEQEAEIKTRLETARTEATAELQTKLTEAEAKAGAPQIVQTGGLHPLLITDNPKDLDSYHQNFLKAERWAAKNANGYNSESPDWKEGDREWTGEQVREVFTELKQEHDEIMPAAQWRLAALPIAHAEVKKVYPTFFDTKHEDYQAAHKLLAAHPSLKSDPTAMMFIADGLTKRRERQAKAAAPAPGARTVLPAKPGLPHRNGAKPAVPGAGAPRVAARTTTSTQEVSANDLKNLQSASGDSAKSAMLKKMLANTGVVNGRN